MEENLENKNKKVIEFNNIKKSFEYIKKLGFGGTGDTHLLKDNTTNMEFAFKKYVPKVKNMRNELYERFVDEIKILFQVSHPNIVRIYNYYLYPENKLGYLQMEYIDGVSVDKYIECSDLELNNIFLQVINAFRYLEEKNILHRDIRPENILIDKKGNVKIIDFGFGKIIDKDEKNNNSVCLNWPVDRLPEEIALNGEYTHCTEIYFIGKLFEYILKEKRVNIGGFSYFNIIKKMVEYQVEDRYQSFEEVYNDISSGLFNELNFLDDEKEIYREFSEAIYNKLIEYTSEYTPIMSIEKIIEQLANVLRKNSLENNIQNNQELINCFIKNGYKYNNAVDIDKKIVENFYKWLIALPNNKKINVIENINTKLANIEYEKAYDDLPF